MSRNGKGSTRRGGADDHRRYQAGWERIFGRNNRPRQPHTRPTKGRKP